MQLQTTTDYAIRTMLFLYIRRDQSATSGEEIANAMHIPVTYIPKVVKKLKDADLIEAIIGVNGGYRILDMLGEVSLYDIIQASEPEKINRCLEDKHPCNWDAYGTCSVCKFYQLQQEEWDLALKSMTLRFMNSNPNKEEIQLMLERNRQKAKGAEKYDGRQIANN